MSKSFKYLIFSFIVFFSCGNEKQFSNNIPSVDKESQELDQYLNLYESRFDIKPGNQAKIIWTDTIHKVKTNFSILYLHGFSGSSGEGEDLCLSLAESYGYNLFLSRLSEHGLVSDNPMLDLTAGSYWESAKFTFAIAKNIGHKVIIVSTSTGGTLALMLAARYGEDIAAIINMSPNVKLKDKFAFILNNTFGLSIAKMIIGGDYKISDEDSDFFRKYWYKKYRVEALVALQDLLEYNMNEDTFSKIFVPTLNLYYDGDDLVDVDAIKQMHSHISSPIKQIKNFPNANTHTIGTPFYSKDYESVNNCIIEFIDGIMD